MHSFEAKLEIIGINPFVFVPEQILEKVFQKAKKRSGPVPVHGTVNGKKYIQTLVRYSGAWRLYINTTMLANSPQQVGERIKVSIDFDGRDRTIKIHPLLSKALKLDTKANSVFKSLPPSRRKEIVRYIASLKTEESIKKNVERAVTFLKGKGRFAGRDAP